MSTTTSTELKVLTTGILKGASSESMMPCHGAFAETTSSR
jgi:hypothetical protein